MEKFKLTLDEIAATTNESRPVVYDAIKATHADGTPHLKTFLVGRRRFARPEAVREWIDYLEAESAAGRPVSYRARRVGRLGGAS